MHRVSFNRPQTLVLAEETDLVMAEANVEYQHDKERETQAASASGSASETEEIGAVNISEGALLRKIDFRLLPAVGILYLLSFLDRSNVSNARIEGLATDLGMSE